MEIQKINDKFLRTQEINIDLEIEQIENTIAKYQELLAEYKSLKNAQKP